MSRGVSIAEPERAGAVRCGAASVETTTGTTGGGALAPTVLDGPTVRFVGSVLARGYARALAAGAVTAGTITG